MTELKKRFTDTDKWSDPWFASLPKEGKLIWQFLCDRCDEAGFWTVNLRDLTHFTEANRKDWDAFLAAAEANRVRVIGEKAWLVKFIGFQFPRGLHPKDPSRVAILRSLKQANAEDLLRGLVAPTKSLIMNLLEGAGQDPPGSLGEGAGAGAGEVLPSEGEGECRGGAGTAERPGLTEVLAFASTIGLADWKAKDWLEEMQACGWRDYNRRDVVAWRPMLTRVRTKWEADGRPSGPPGRKPINGDAKPQSVFELKTIIDAKQSQIAELKRKFCNEFPLGDEWSNEDAKKQFGVLRREIKELTARIGSK